MLKKIVIAVSEEAALWARRQASAKNTSISRLAGKLLEDQIHLSDEYWKAFADWNALDAIPGIDAAGRLSRDDAHARR